MDANLLIYAHVVSSPQHGEARAWLDEQLSGTAKVGLPWPSLLAFVRLVTNPRVFARPSSIADAWRQVEEWLDVECTWIPVPGDRHREILATLLRDVVAANHVPDAHLAALAVEHGLMLCSTDRDFARFERLHWENPIARPPAGR